MYLLVSCTEWMNGWMDGWMIYHGCYRDNKRGGINPLSTCSSVFSFSKRRIFNPLDEIESLCARQPEQMANVSKLTLFLKAVNVSYHSNVHSNSKRPLLIDL